MPSNPEPTAAEQAAANEIDRDAWQTCTHDVQPCEHHFELARDVVVAVQSRRFDGILGWTIAEHSDGSGEPALYHECSPHSALERLDVVDLVQVLVFIDRHVCGKPDTAIWELPALDQSGEGQANG